jgi:hypothetical protein
VSLEDSLVRELPSGRRRHGETPGALSDAKPFEEPSLFDLTKELNAHARRLSTLLGLLMAATSLTLSNEAVRSRLVARIPAWSEWAAVRFLGIYLVLALIGTVGSLQPAFPVPIDDEDRCASLVVVKQGLTDLTMICIAASVFALMATGMDAFTGWPVSVAILVSLAAVLVYVSRAVNGNLYRRKGHFLGQTTFTTIASLRKPRQFARGLCPLRCPARHICLGFET